MRSPKRGTLLAAGAAGAADSDVPVEPGDKTPTGRKGVHEHVTTNNPVDQHVGRRVRERRLLIGLSQSALAQQIGVTGQQYQKYEKGENRISASRLFDLANSLKVAVSYFFDEMSDETKVASPAHILSSAPPLDIEVPPNLTSYARRQTLELLRLWQQLPDHARGRVVDLVRSMVELNSEARSKLQEGDVEAEHPVHGR